MKSVQPLLESYLKFCISVLSYKMLSTTMINGCIDDENIICYIRVGGVLAISGLCNQYTRRENHKHDTYTIADLVNQYILKAGVQFEIRRVSCDQCVCGSIGEYE